MARQKLTQARLTQAQATIGTGERLRIWDSELPGYGAIIGSAAVSLVVQHRVSGRQKLRTIGRLGSPGPDGKPWTEARARKAAMRMLGSMSAGVDPKATATTGEGITLGQGLDLHLKNMRKKNRSPRSIDTLDKSIRLYLKDWLKRPIVELTGAELEAVCERLIKKAKPRAGAVNPPGAALTKRLVAQVSAIWNAVDRVYDLPGKSPAKRITTHTLKARDERIADGSFKEWRTKVETLSPVRRDLQLFCLFTGLRSESARTLEWADVNGTELHVKRAKGDKPYTIPMTATVAEILERRRKENAVEFGPHGGDHGLAFPTLTRARPYKVQPVAEPKEWRTDSKTGARERYLPGLHALRRTWNSIAIEAGIPGEHRRALMNHEGQGVNLRHYGRPETWPAVRKSAETVEAELRQRLGLDKAAKAKRRRRRS
jgi:integrase